ncbi:ATPase family AAA domain-containing protein 5 [Caerostris darwini]|uniref:ATPase family AAA domain-containing protein 5 n=1 Tax=Caerostris darwini TaxID=1538125 RepID=A0AAV4MRU1_9ARAC|nr:ATPase family AAA domain-containing protein 5 [Caerostris darwini]
MEVTVKEEEKVRSSTRISKVKSYSEFCDTDELSWDDDKPSKKRIKKLSNKAKKVTSKGKVHMPEIKTNEIKSNNELKLFPIFTSTNLQTQHKSECKKPTEEICTLKEYTNNSTKQKKCMLAPLFTKKSVKISQDNNMPTSLETKKNIKAGETSKVFMLSNTIEDNTETLITKVVEEIDNSIPDKIEAIKSDNSHSDEKVRVKRKRNIKSHVKSNSCETENKKIFSNDVNEIELEQRSPRNGNNVNISTSKLEQVQKIFPIFNNSITEKCMATSHLQVKDRNLNIPTENGPQHLNGVEEEKWLFLGNSSNNVSSDKDKQTKPVAPILSILSRNKCKLIEINDISSENISHARITRSQTRKQIHSLEKESDSLDDNSSEVYANIIIKKKSHKKRKKPDILKLLPQSHEYFKNKSKKNLKAFKPEKVYPLFANSKVLEVKAATQNKSRNKSKTHSLLKEEEKSKRLQQKNTASELLDETEHQNNKRRSRRKMSNVSRKDSEEEIEMIQMPNVINTDNSRNKQQKCEYSVYLNSGTGNKTEVLSDCSVTINRKKESASFKKNQIFFSYPLISHSNALEMASSSNLSNFHLKEDLLDEVEVPLWNKIMGLTDIKNIDKSNSANFAGNMDDKFLKNEHASENDTLLWTDISNDYNLKEGISESTISDLNSWLLQWKSKFTKNEKAKRNESDDSFDSFSSDSSDSFADGLSNSVIIMGPPGSGKTSLVFSLANDHGFKVLEVNASSCRSGRNINSQLREALESYHVESTKIDFSKEDNLSVRGSSCSTSKHKKIRISVKKNTNDCLQNDKKLDKNKNSKNETVKNFFHKKSASLTKSSAANEKSGKFIDVSASKSTSCSISTQTIILFDDMDVVFKEDDGLWSTIRGFLKISKKPVIFTVSRNLAVVKANLDADIRVLYLNPMIHELAIDKLNSQYEKYHRKNSNINMKLLVNNTNDVRRSLLHAQFWSQQCYLSSSSVHSNNKFNLNTFLLGSLDFSAIDFCPFIFKKETNFSTLISEYIRIGYDILYSNLFAIFDIDSGSEIARSWQMVTKKPENNHSADLEDMDTKSDNDLWHEACAIFSLKKQILQKGSLSGDLLLFSDILEDFSFVDTLKGCFCKNMKWISLPERIKKWILGLPICCEQNNVCFDDSILDMMSMVQTLKLQTTKTKYIHNNYQNGQNRKLILEHPFVNFNNVNEQTVEMQLKSIASEFPVNHMLNKTAFNLDYLSTLKIICQQELLKQSKCGKRSNRFLHYFDSISLYIDKTLLEQCLG